VRVYIRVLDDERRNDLVGEFDGKKIGTSDDGQKDRKVVVGH